ncbi:MAG: transketolase [Candidatus Kerfeldbacteria bacterium]|nr:transketolase [Candidatus Kerfeldbacteria bacterium]
MAPRPTPNSRLEQLTSLATLVRSWIVRSTTAAGSGHPSSSLSATDLMVGLLFGGHFRADLARPEHPSNDRLIFSKGHASPLLYALYAAAGKVTPRALLSLRKFHSNLEGHPMPAFKYTEVPTGSLGQGLSVGVGMALNARLDRLPYRTYVLLGDSEMTEGSVWEAVGLAAYERLGNLTAILDVNRLGQRGPTMFGHRVEEYERRVASFGWKPIVIDGHDLAAIDRAYRTASAETHRPTMIIAKTLKGKGVSFIENVNGWHGRALSREQLAQALKELGPVDVKLKGEVKPPPARIPRAVKTRPAQQPQYGAGDVVAPRQAVANALVRLALAHPALIVLDAEVSNSTYTEQFGTKFPKRFIQTFIAEQNMVGIATGLARCGKLPVAATFAAFFTRAHDQLRMAQYAGTHQVFVGTHAGVSIGEDGASQMGLEDIALFRTLQGSTVLYPSDAYAAERLTELALASQGLVYIRATRGMVPVLYDAKTRFNAGGSHTLRTSRHDRATIVAAGITLHEALVAADQLARRRIAVRVIDLYSIKPIDVRTLRRAAEQTSHLVVVEDHVEPGGMAEAVRSALGRLSGTVTSLAANRIPHSGTPRELLAQQGIDAEAIVQTVRSLL